jgi:hypothetical protein
MAAASSAFLIKSSCHQACNPSLPPPFPHAAATLFFPSSSTRASTSRHRRPPAASLAKQRITRGRVSSPPPRTHAPPCASSNLDDVKVRCTRPSQLVLEFLRQARRHVPGRGASSTPTSASPRHPSTSSTPCELNRFPAAYLPRFSCTVPVLALTSVPYVFATAPSPVRPSRRPRHLLPVQPPLLGKGL